MSLGEEQRTLVKAAAVGVALVALGAGAVSFHALVRDRFEEPAGEEDPLAQIANPLGVRVSADDFAAWVRIVDEESPDERAMRLALLRDRGHDGRRRCWSDSSSV